MDPFNLEQLEWCAVKEVKSGAICSNCAARKNVRFLLFINYEKPKLGKERERKSMTANIFFSLLLLQSSLAGMVAIYAIVSLAISAISAILLHRMISAKSKSLKQDDEMA
jgi:hypothetical protein